MDKETQREHRCCFTGHRPEKLTISEARLAELLEAEIKKAIDRQFTTFITGMAKGTDLIAAEIVLRLREEDPRLRLVAALPYPNVGQRWGGGWTERFQRVLSAADRVVCICPRSSCLLPAQEQMDGQPQRPGNRGVQRRERRNEKHPGLRQETAGSLRGHRHRNKTVI